MAAFPAKPSQQLQRLRDLGFLSDENGAGASVLCFEHVGEEVDCVGVLGELAK